MGIFVLEILWNQCRFKLQIVRRKSRYTDNTQVVAAQVFFVIMIFGQLHHLDGKKSAGSGERCRGPFTENPAGSSTRIVGCLAGGGLRDDMLLPFSPMDHCSARVGGCNDFIIVREENRA